MAYEEQSAPAAAAGTGRIGPEPLSKGGGMWGSASQTLTRRPERSSKPKEYGIPAELIKARAGKLA
ncbi:hypothetical protein ABT150_18835 [Streptomyces mirabilis]|uniref:hypothetical protein n=1 Tax=Streptomyces mirabilis TaxID=68239 RepID=UPI00331CBF4C